MLTTSPIISTSSKASPTSFHYAPTRPSPHSSPSRLSALSRQHRSAHSASLTSSPIARTSATTTAATSTTSSSTRQYVGVDAGTQYSPMEPVNYYAPWQPSTPAIPPPPPHPQPLDSLATTQTPQTHEPAASTYREAEGSTLSPGKRRGSPIPATSPPISNATPASPSNMTKRPKTSPLPPKILPQRYELCGVEDMVVLISHMLAELIETNDALALRSGSLTRFHSR
jgi:hypothetical protein